MADNKSNTRIITVFDKKWLYGSKSQELLLEKIKPNQKLFKCVINDRHSWRIFEEDEILDTILNNNGYICEVLYCYPKKVYFDIDCNDPDKLNLDNVKLIINKYFENPIYAISGSEIANKKSYHIILTNYIIKNINDMQNMKLIVNYIKEYECEYFDCSVYSKNKAMKCINQSKPEREQQLIIENNNPKNHFINSFFNGTEKQIQQIQNEIQEKTKNINLLDFMPKDNKPVELPNNFIPEDLINAKKLLMLMPCNEDTKYPVLYKMIIFCINNGLSFDDFWIWKQQKSTKSKDKYLYEWNNTAINHKEYIFSIHTMNKCLQCIYPQLVDVECDKDIFTKKFNKSLDIKQITLINRIEKEHFLVKEKAILFNIGMGGGKTTMTVEYLKESNENFIWLAPRVALVMNTDERFKSSKMNVVNYLNCGKSREIKMKKINDANNIILECESLNYIKDTKKYNIVVIDEIESVLNSWDSDTHKDNIISNFNNFCNLLKNCKKIILLDAFITTKTINFLELLGINDIIIYGSNYKPVKKELVFNNGYIETIDKICNDLFNKKKLYIFYAFKSSSKTKHFSIEELKTNIIIKCYENKIDYIPKILIYHGDVDDKTKKTLNNVNIEWDKYDVIITTSCITVGVNYEGNNYDKIYLMVSSCVNSPRDVIQTSMRIRNPKENIIEIFFFDKMKKIILKRPPYYNKEYTEEEIKLINFETEIKPTQNVYKLLIDNIFIEKQSNFMEVFFRLCDITNYNYGNYKNNKEKIKNEKFKNDLFESKILLSYKSLNNIEDNNIKEYEIKVWDYEATMIEKFEIEKYYFNHKFWKLDDDDKEFIWDNRLSKFFENRKCKIVELIIEDNKIEDLEKIKPSKIIISDKTKEYIDKNYSFINVKKENQKIIKIINNELGNNIIINSRNKNKTKSHRGEYIWSDMFYELENIYKKTIVNYDIENDNDEINKIIT